MPRQRGRRGNGVLSDCAVRSKVGEEGRGRLYSSCTISMKSYA